MTAPHPADLGTLADALALAAHRLRGPLKEADHAATLDTAAHLMVERITADPDLMLALRTIRVLRHGSYGGLRE